MTCEDQHENERRHPIQLYNTKGHISGRGHTANSIYLEWLCIIMKALCTVRIYTLDQQRIQNSLISSIMCAHLL